jgi:hypothetical protein
VQYCTVGLQDLAQLLPWQSWIDAPTPMHLAFGFKLVFSAHRNNANCPALSRVTLIVDGSASVFDTNILNQIELANELLAKTIA